MEYTEQQRISDSAIFRTLQTIMSRTWDSYRTHYAILIKIEQEWERTQIKALKDHFQNIWIFLIFQKYIYGLSTSWTYRKIFLEKRSERSYENSGHFRMSSDDMGS